MRSGPSLLLTLLSLHSSGCIEELPPLVPFVDLGPLGEALDADTDSAVDIGGSTGLDMASVDDVGTSDASGFDRGLLPDVVPFDGGPFDADIDDAERDDGLDSEPDAVGSYDMVAPDLDPLDQSPPEPDMRSPLPDIGPPLVREACNGIDDDADGMTDEEPNCGPLIAERCQVFLGFYDFFGAPGVYDTWGSCPEQTTDGFNLDSIGCVGTLNDHRFRRLRMAGSDVNNSDVIAFAFICDDDAIGGWLESRCEVLFGHADGGQGDAPASRDEWGAFGGEDPARFASVSTSGDGRFHAMRLLGDVGDDDSFAIAFRCDDPAQPERAAAAEASAAVILGWADSDGGADDLSASWMDGCPAPDGTAFAAGPGIGCAGSNFDGRFYRIDLSGEVNGDDHLGIALIPRPPRDIADQPRP